MGKAWKSFEMQARKSVYCHEGTVKGNSSESAGEKSKEKRIVEKANMNI